MEPYIYQASGFESLLLREAQGGFSAGKEVTYFPFAF